MIGVEQSPYACLQNHPFPLSEHSPHGPPLFASTNAPNVLLPDLISAKRHGHRARAFLPTPNSPTSYFTLSPAALRTSAVSPDNHSRMELNHRIHRLVQHAGHVDAREHRVRVLVSRQEVTGACGRSSTR